MSDLRERVLSALKQLPVPQRVMLAVTSLVLVGGLALFGRWITQPSYTLLYAGLDAKTLAQVIDHLETSAVPYQLEGGGKQVLVPRNDVYKVRANLAQDGMVEAAVPAGWELLDEQGFTTSNFRQQVDYRRALQGELAKTLSAMSGIRSATVHLVMPEEALFASEKKPTTASVLLDTSRQLTQPEIEAVVYLTSASVEGLTNDGVTVADARGQVLHAPDADGQTATLTSRYLRQTREFESALSSDIVGLLTGVVGRNRVSALVRAELDFDKVVEESENFDPDQQVVIRDSEETEILEGNGAGPGGVLGVDGGEIDMDTEGAYRYERNERATEHGVGRTVTTTERAPGRIESLSVALIIDEEAALEDEELEELVVAALGLNEARGDTVAISRAPFPTVGEPEVSEPITSLIPQIVSGLALLGAVAVLFLLSRRKTRKDDEVETAEPVVPEAAAKKVVEQNPIQRDVVDMIHKQPADVAALLRSWVAEDSTPTTANSASSSPAGDSGSSDA